MEIESLYYFEETARDLHITRTAHRLHISQQTLSNHIMRLEEYYGAKLFYRYPALQLTSAGQEVLKFARKLHNEETARDLHITRTAHRLDISQQTLSNHIMRLEEYYGAKLFYRYPALQLTTAGQEVLKFARRLHQEGRPEICILRGLRTGLTSASRH